MDKTDFCSRMLKQTDEFRSALETRWLWFIHVTPASRLDSIREHGLLPYSVSQCPSDVTAALGSGASNILCLRPLEAQRASTGSGYGPKATLAIASSLLPSRVCLDWSYEWGLICDRWDRGLSKPYAEFACGIADEWGSIACYEGIPPGNLRLRTFGCEADPAKWPRLIEAENQHALLAEGI